jgi:hypothetical protein
VGERDEAERLHRIAVVSVNCRHHWSEPCSTLLSRSMLRSGLETGNDQAMAGKGGKRSTSWQPGQSGNPHSRPSVVAEVRDLAREHTAEAISVLTTIMNDSKVAAAARVAAATAVLDRGWGRPSQHIEGAVNVVSPEAEAERARARKHAFDLLDQLARGRLVPADSLPVAGPEPTKRLPALERRSSLPKGPEGQPPAEPRWE